MIARSPDIMRLLVFRLLVLALAVLAVFLLLTSADAGEPVPPSGATHVVARGDTLWRIAGGVAGEGSDRRVAVAELMELNGLDDATIHPGQVLALPLP